MKKILYISGSIGLGHIIRDLAIANELRRQNSEIEISWLAASPASIVIKNAGEKLLPEADLYADETASAENTAKDFKMNILKYMSNSKKEWAHNVEVFKQAISREQFDLVIGDETYEIDMAICSNPSIKKVPFVMIYDFLGMDSMTNNPLDKLGVYIVNRGWVKDDKRIPVPLDLKLFVGEPEDIPDKKFGFLLPNRRDHAKVYYEFVGHILSFDPLEYIDKAKVRAKLGYGKEPLIVCSIGGTSIGKKLLELCGEAYPIIRKEIPGIRMVLVCGPRLAAESLKAPQEVEVRDYVPALYEHFAASDLAIVQGGGNTTLELTALRRPFLYFPIEAHFEQQIHVAWRLSRHRAGVKMLYSQTTATLLAENVIANIGKEVNYVNIPTDGAQRAAQLISQFL